MAENYQSIFEGERMDELWTLAGTAVQKAKVNGQIISPVSGVLTLPDYPTELTWETITGKPSWIGNTKPSYTLAELTGDTTHRVVTDAQITAWTGKQASLGSGTEGQILQWTNGAPAWSAAPATGVTSLGGKTGTIGVGNGLTVDATKVLSLTADYQAYISNGNTAYGWGNHANAGYASASSLGNYLPLSGGTLTGDLRVDKGFYFGDTSEIYSAYLSIHPEKGGSNILPFFTNDIAFLLKRGGYAEIYYTTATDYTPATIAKRGMSVSLESCFNGSADYCHYSIESLSSKVVIDLTLHTVFYYTNVFYIDFGSAWWGARKITVLAGKDNGTYTEVGQIDSVGDVSYYKCNIDVGDTGVNKIRIVLTNYNTTTPRIAQIGFLNFGSLLGRETFMSRGMDDELFRNLVPQTSTYNLGESNKPWGKIYANKWFPKPGDESVFAEYADDGFQYQSAIYSNRYNAFGNTSGAAFVFNKRGDYFGIGASSGDYSNVGIGTVYNIRGDWKSELITITNDGNVGIVTTSPEARLHIAGGLKIAGNFDGATGISMTAVSEPTPSDLEVVIRDGKRYLHTNLPFFSDQQVAAGNYKDGGGWGLSTAYLNRVNLADGAVMRFGVKINGDWATLTDDASYGKTISINCVTSIEVPTGFIVSEDPITKAGTLEIGFDDGYSLPTTEKQTSWDSKQDALVSGINIKTINNIPILGRGNIVLPDNDRIDALEARVKALEDELIN